MKIIHVMKDGSVRSSIEGVVVPAGHPVYQIILNMQNGKEWEKRETSVDDECARA